MSCCQQILRLITCFHSLLTSCNKYYFSHILVLLNLLEKMNYKTGLAVHFAVIQVDLVKEAVSLYKIKRNIYIYFFLGGVEHAMRLVGS